METSILLGRTLTECTAVDDELIMVDEHGNSFKFYHDQDCCEHVQIAQIDGNLSDLVGSPITMAESVSNKGGDPAPEYPDSWTWTFYKFATVKGYVTVRWLGTSNGYYSEGVDLAVNGERGYPWSDPPKLKGPVNAD